MKFTMPALLLMLFCQIADAGQARLMRQERGTQFADKQVCVYEYLGREIRIMIPLGERCESTIEM